MRAATVIDDLEIPFADELPGVANYQMSNTADKSFQSIQADLIEIKIAAYRIGLTPNCAYKRNKQGKLPIKVRRIGGRLYISNTDINEFHANGGWDTFNVSKK